MIISAEILMSVFTDEGSHRLRKCLIFLIDLASVSGKIIKVSIRHCHICKMQVHTIAWQ